MSSRLKIVIGVLGSICVVLVAAFFILRQLITKSFPTVEGTVNIEGLERPVTIFRDEFGVPHVLAQNEHDLFFAQGYVHAQDRLWQMDVTRRAGEGRLSEVFGSFTLQFDKLFRTVRIREISRELEAHLHPDSRRILQAYSDGVNAFIRSHRGKYPVEFDMLNYVPEEWTPLHSIYASRLMAWELDASWYVDLVLGEVVEKLGEEKAREVFPGYPADAPVIVPKELRGRKISVNANFLQDADRGFRQFFGLGSMHSGSNAWAVGPQKSLSGKALLANDPHLGFSSPSKWYEVHLSAGEFNVAGVSLPGSPCVVIGHNTRIAWGLTNIMADDADFYIEMTDSTHADQYLFRGEWRPMSTQIDTVVVKDSASVILRLQSTHHGPVINDINAVGKLTKEHPVTMRWTGQEVSDELHAIYLINKATRWNEFLEGVSEFAVPGQNFVYADEQGNIGYYAGVKLPIRQGRNPTFPFPGWTGEYEWSGFVPFEKLPFVYNPPSHFVATANNKMTDDSYPFHISDLWEPPSRIQRIQEYLQSREKFSADDFRKMQMDLYSCFARETTPFIIHAYDSVVVSDADVGTALKYFHNWNFQLRPEDVPTTIFHVFFTHFIKNIFRSPMGDTLYQKYIFLGNIPYRVVASLLRKPSSVWFDDPTTVEIETRDEVIRKSLEDAIRDLRESVGGEMKTWRWGDLHTVTFDHPFGSLKPLSSIFNVGPFPIGGATTTINNGEYRLSKPYRVTLGPSTRQIVDFAVVDEALSVIPTGESGQALQEHYSDQSQLWLNGEYHTLPLGRARVEAVARHRLNLLPVHQ